MADFPAYKPYDPGTTKSKYDTLRTRARQDANVAAEQNVGALQRRFAAQGMVNSGEAIKQEQLAREESDKGAQQANENIDFAQAQEQAAQQDAENQRAFAREERVGGQQFAREERLQAQGFSKSLFDQDMAFKQKQQSFAESSFAKQFDEGVRNSDRTYDLEREAQSFNEEVAKGKYDKPDLMEQIMNPAKMQGPVGKAYRGFAGMVTLGGSETGDGGIFGGGKKKHKYY